MAILFAANASAQTALSIEVFVDRNYMIDLQTENDPRVQVYQVDEFNVAITQINGILKAQANTIDVSDITQLVASFQDELLESQTALAKVHQYRLTHLPAWVVNEGEAIFYGQTNLENILARLSYD